MWVQSTPPKYRRREPGAVSQRAQILRHPYLHAQIVGPRAAIFGRKAHQDQLFSSVVQPTVVHEAKVRSPNFSTSFISMFSRSSYRINKLKR